MIRILAAMVTFGLCACAPPPIPQQGEAVDGGAGVIVSYDYGNQINRSQLLIFDSGEVQRGEATCCPPTTSPVTEPALESGQLSTLKANIARVKAAPLVTAAGTNSCEGCSSGTLFVYQGGLRYIVRTITLTQSQTPEQVVYCSAPEANAIQDLVTARTAVDMPR